MRPMGNAFKPLYSKMKNIMQHCGLIEFLKTVTFMVFYHRLPHTVRKMISIFLSAFFSFACIEEQRRAGSKSGLCVFQVIWSSFFFFSFSICCFVLFFLLLLLFCFSFLLQVVCFEPQLLVRAKYTPNSRSALTCKGDSCVGEEKGEFLFLA